MGVRAASFVSAAALVAACAPHGSPGPSVTAPTSAAAVTPGRLSYPAARRGDVVDEYHGTKVADPYRWLEDPDAPESRAWIDAQNALTAGWIGGVSARDRIADRLRTLWNYTRWGVPTVEAGRTFFTRNDGLQNQDVFCVVDRPGAEPRVLIDPNSLSADGTVSASRYSVSRDGQHVAYGVSAGGSDWLEFRVRRVDTGQDLPDVLKWVKFSSASWTADGKGFYYSRYDEPKDADKKLQGVNYYQKLYLHRLGTSQDADELIYERPDRKEWGWGGAVTEDGRFLVIHAWEGTDPKNGIFIKDLAADGPVVELFADFDASWQLVGSQGPVLWFMTDKDAPRQRLVAVDTRKPEPAAWREVVPQAAETLEGADVVGDRFVARYLKDAYTVVRLFHLDGRLDRELPLPTLGTAWGLTGWRTDREVFYGFSSFTFPTTIYRYDFETGTSSVYKAPAVALDPERFEVKQVFYRSKDGTRVPMFIAHKKGLVLDGDRPTQLYGYGGFNVSLTPTYSTSIRVWMEMGGVYAVANLRGGGEYGEQWHLAGTKERKQNVFDDFIAAGEWLIAQGYTKPSRLAVSGGSNGGLLIGAVITQRPELFGAALPAVGVLDMLRFHKFTIGWAWVSDYGSSDDPEEFAALRAYSPLHNLKRGVAYPATLVTTADHDDRVVPAHSFKFAAALQWAQGGPAATLIRIETQAGHGAGTPTDKLITLYADKWSFLVRALGMDVPEALGQ